MPKEIVEIPQLTEEETLRFWSKVDKTPGYGPNGDCWEWTASKDGCGYGRFNVKRNTWRMYGAHRLSYALEHGHIPRSLLALHKCDNPACVRPDHLWLGTTADNVKDRVRKGRTPSGDDHYSRRNPDCMPRGDEHYSRIRPECMSHGEEHHRHRLTESEVLEIRARYKSGDGTHRGLAKEYNVGKATIRDAIIRKTWKHI